MKRVRAVLCGDASVGKSAIIKRFSTGTFNEALPETIAGAFHSSYVRRNGETIALEIWDTAGSERYHSVIPSFFKNAAAVVIVYDITSRSTFESVPYWGDFARSNAPTGAPQLLVGNKSDLFTSRAVFLEESKEFAAGRGFVGFVETSAKTGEGIDTLFTMLAELPANGMVEVEEINRGEVISLDKSQCDC
jgi:small GTP-binding protein